MGFLLFSRLGRWDGALVVTLGMLLRLINSRFIIIIIIIIIIIGSGGLRRGDWGKAGCGRRL